MSFEFFFVVKTDNRVIALTTASNRVESFDGQEYSFLNEVSSYSIPPNRINPFSSGGVGAATVKLSFFDDSVTPGNLLDTYAKIQGSELKAWAMFDDGTKDYLFSGEVKSVSYQLEQKTIEIEAGQAPRNIMIPFPPAKTLDEGRFVERASYHFAIDYTNTGTRGGRVKGYAVWLRDKFYFTTAFGSPIDPLYQADGTGNPSYQATFIETDINALMDNGNTVITNDPDGKTFLWWDSAAKDSSLPVIYGSAINMSLAPLAHYRVRVRVHFNNDELFEYYKIYIYPIACHKILGDPRSTFRPSTSSPYTKKPDFMIGLRWGDDFHMPEDYSEGKPGNASLGYLMNDGLNFEVPYTSLAVPYTDETFEQVNDTVFRQYRNFTPRDVYASVIKGRLRHSSQALNRLGDVIEDMWLTFGGGVQDSIDWNVVSANKNRLNDYTAALVFNSSRKNQTLERVLNSRVSQSFPVTFTAPKGKLAWICTSLPLIPPISSRHLKLGVDLVGLRSLSETKRSSVINNINVSYGLDGKKAGQSQSSRITKTNSEICRASHYRWGPSQRKQINCPDTQDPVTANQIAQEVANLSAGVRIEVSYHSFDYTLKNIDILSVVEVTDPIAGFENTKFWFLGYLLGQDGASIFMDLLSVDML